MYGLASDNQSAFLMALLWRDVLLACCSAHVLQQIFDDSQADSTEHLRERWAGLFDGGSIDNFNALLDEDGRDDTVGAPPASPAAFLQL